MCLTLITFALPIATLSAMASLSYSWENLVNLSPLWTNLHWRLRIPEELRRKRRGCRSVVMCRERQRKYKPCLLAVILGNLLSQDGPTVGSDEDVAVVQSVQTHVIHKDMAESEHPGTLLSRCRDSLSCARIRRWRRTVTGKEVCVCVCLFLTIGGVTPVTSQLRNRSGWCSAVKRLFLIFFSHIIVKTV